MPMHRLLMVLTRSCAHPKITELLVSCLNRLLLLLNGSGHTVFHSFQLQCSRFPERTGLHTQESSQENAKQSAGPDLGAEEAVQQGGHERRRLLLGDAHMAHEVLRAIQPPSCRVPAMQGRQTFQRPTQCRAPSMPSNVLHSHHQAVCYNHRRFIAVQRPGV